jgi:hypothetical protein
VTVLAVGTALFEVPDRSSARRLSRLLSPRPTTFGHRQDVDLVFVDFGDDSDDLAVLLRDVQEWLAEEGLDSIWFVLDGRTYLIQPR